jgi:hypothetical protein
MDLVYLHGERVLQKGTSPEQYGWKVTSEAISISVWEKEEHRTTLEEEKKRRKAAISASTTEEAPKKKKKTTLCE